MYKKRFTLSALITLVVLAVTVAVSVTMMIAIRHFNQQVNAVMQKQAMYTHISDIDTKVRDYYPSIDEEQLQAGIAAGYVAGLNDPYAAYFTHDAYTKALLERGGQRSDLGIVLTTDDKGNLVVEKVYADSAAQKGGVWAGDVLVSVDGESTTGAALQTVQQKLNTTTKKVMLSVKRSDKTMSFELTASTYSIDTVSDRMINSTIGYIRVSAFYDNTASQFMAAYSALQNDGATAYIFDLRGCSTGGSRSSLEGILSYLMPHGAYATYTAADGTTVNLVAHSAHSHTAPTVVLVNGTTKGEAELMAGVMQEFRVATVVGEKTVGKGKLQDFVTLKKDNSALLLTVGEISLISGGSIEGVGITPNTTVPMSAYKSNRIGLIEDKEDDQLQAALKVLSENVSGNIGTETVGTTVAGTTTTTAATTATTTTTKK